MRCGEARLLFCASCGCCKGSRALTCALSAVIEKYTRNTRFCLICNYVSKIIPALQSRCTRFRFPPLPGDYVRERLQYVIDHEQCGPPCMTSACACLEEQCRLLCTSVCHKQAFISCHCNWL